MKEYLFVKRGALGNAIKSQSMLKAFRLLLENDCIMYYNYDKLAKRLGVKTRSASYKIVQKLLNLGLVSHIIALDANDKAMHILELRNTIYID